MIFSTAFAIIIKKKKYKKWDFLKKGFDRKIKGYIWKACEICWIMILMKPELTFFPSSFDHFKNKKIPYSRYEKHDLWTGSKTKNKARILFFALPSFVQKHILNSEQQLHVIKGRFFSHNDEERMKYIMSDPDKLLKSVKKT